jgi:RNA polymerase sigma-70 factor (ECF subfamily)
MNSQKQGIEELIAQVREGGQTALAELFMDSQHRLRRLVQARLDARVAGRVDVSDVLQETFIDASRQLDGYLADPPMSPFLWLRFLTRQRLMATHRHHMGVQMRDAKRDVPLSRISVFDPNLPSPPSRLRGVRNSLAGRLELRARLQTLLDGLSPADREILRLRHFEELSNSQAAEKLGISKAAASKRYARALERLRKSLSHAA